MVAVGNWMRNKETAEAVKVKSVGPVMVGYANSEVDGEVSADKLIEHFDVMDNPSEREDIEFLLKSKYEAGEIDTGLFDVGLSYVVVDHVDGHGVTFQWFEHMTPFSDVLID